MAGLSDAFDATVEANRHLIGGLDDALVASGRTIAKRVDEAIETGEGQEVTKALYLVPHLMNVLGQMFATPKARKDAGIEEESARGKLAALRDARPRSAPSKKRAAS